MRRLLLPLLILNLIAISQINAYQMFDATKRPLLSFFVDAPEPSKCVVDCFEPLKTPIMDFFHKTISVNSTDNICRALVQTKSCLATQSSCTDQDRSIMKKLTKGFEWGCGNEGIDTLARVNHCIMSIPEEDRFFQGCRDKCNTSNMEPELLPKPKTPNLAGRLEHFCRPLACHLNCTAMSINRFCPTAGSRLVNQFLMMFDAMALEMGSTARQENVDMLRIIPADCRPLLENKELMAIRFDAEFILDVIYLLVTASQRYRKTAQIEAERFLAEFDQTGVLMDRKNAHVPLPPSEWSPANVGMLVLMIAIMLLNIVGLVFTIVWCLSIQHENGEPIHNSVSANFLEPNIRMKLKLPKMKIHDSEVLKLRVPRNGNQFHQDEEEQLVTVQRQKRRRTYSVPLEPRTRTESTGSDKFQRIFVLRHQHDHV